MNTSETPYLLILKNKQRNFKKLLTRYFVAMNCSLTDQGLQGLSYEIDFENVDEN
jgi:hypothetical protein